MLPFKYVVTIAEDLWIYVSMERIFSSMHNN